jgi:hypothetical protein
LCLNFRLIDEEARKLMLDREEWRSKIKMIVAVNKEVDSSKREHRKIKCIKTRSAIVVIKYFLRPEINVAVALQNKK